MSGAELVEALGAVPAVPSNVLHGALSRPPRIRWDGKLCVASRLHSIDLDSGQTMPGVVQVVQLGTFIGVVAMSAVLARQAVEGLKIRWQSLASFTQTDMSDERESLSQSYTWHPAQQVESDRERVTAWCTTTHVTVWLTCPVSHRRVLTEELSVLLDVPQDRITLSDSAEGHTLDIHVLEVLDAAADAALLSRAVGRPVQIAVQRAAASDDMTLARTIALDTVSGGDSSASRAGMPADRTAFAPRWVASQPLAVRPSIARLLIQPTRAEPIAMSRVIGAEQVSLAAPSINSTLTQASLADIEAMQVFAQETLLDEQSVQLGVDPIEYRLSQLPTGAGRMLVQRVAEQSNWQALARSSDAPQISKISAARTTDLSGRTPLALRDQRDGTVLRGRGYAAAHVRENAPDGVDSETWSAWVVEVEVEPDTGRVDVTRLVVGHDSQSLQSAQQATIHEQDPRLLDAARRLLQASASFDDWSASTVAPASAGDEAITAVSIPNSAVRPTTVDRGQLALDGVMTLPAAAAIGNAIFDATGVRLRQVPFNPEILRVRLAGGVQKQSAARRFWRRGGMWLAAGAGAAAGALSMAWPLKPAIAPTAGPDVSLYSLAAIERGRLVATAGDCMVCHTATGGKENAGGLGLDTPFGTIYTTNITPDNETGIGQWSFSAFDRAMREGVHRDGRQLYPAFPYTSFAKMTDADMQALYAYLMVQPPVRSEPPKTDLAFPYNLRPMLAGWNMLFHETGVYQPDPNQSLVWNRGAYLVQGMGHCAACHSPRNTLGAEKKGIADYLAGGEAEGWEAPPLNRLATGKVPWTADSLFQYLRTGYSANHGVAAGPMAPVIHGLAKLPESDVRAMTTYLLNLPGSPSPLVEPLETALSATPIEPVSDIAVGQPSLAAASGPRLFEGRAKGERIYQNACAVCHEAAAGPTLFGVKPLLSVNTNLHADTPDNLVQVILHGIQIPASDDLGYMPGFKDSLDDEQVQDLLSYLRARFAPQESEWTDSRDLIGRVRNQSH